MKKITQKEMARFVGISPSFMNEIKKGVKGFSKEKAKDLSGRMKIPVELLIYSRGEKLYKVLVFSYLQEVEGDLWEG